MEVDPVLVPAHSLEAEQVCITAAVLDDQARSDLAEFLKPGDFYSPDYAVVLRTAYELDEAGERVDMVSMMARMRASGRLEQLGGSAGFAQMIHVDEPLRNYLDHGRRVVMLARVRAVAGVCGRIKAESCGDLGDAETWLAEAEARIYEAARLDEYHKTTVEIREVVVEEERTARGARITDQEEEDPRGVLTGLVDVDRRIGKLKYGKKYALGGFPGSGKTSLAEQIGVSVAKTGVGVAFGSMEMDRVELVQRAVSVEAMIDNRRCEDYDFGPDPKRGHKDVWSAVTGAWKTLAKLPIVIDDRPTFTIGSLRAWVRRTAAQLERAGSHLGLLVLDHVQCMTSPTGSMDVAGVTELSRCTTQLAKEFGIVVLELHPFNRATHDQKRPTLRSFKGSSAIEHDAYGVFAIHRDDLQQMDRNVHDGKAELLVLKMRGGGETGKVDLHFTDYCTRFDNLAREDSYYEETPSRNSQPAWAQPTTDDADPFEEMDRNANDMRAGKDQW